MRDDMADTDDVKHPRTEACAFRIRVDLKRLLESIAARESVSLSDLLRDMAMQRISASYPSADLQITTERGETDE